MTRHDERRAGEKIQFNSRNACTLQTKSMTNTYPYTYRISTFQERNDGRCYCYAIAIAVAIAVAVDADRDVRVRR